MLILRTFSKKLQEMLEQKKNIYIVLIVIFLFAVFLRCLMPVYLAKTNNYFRPYMIASSQVYDTIAISIALAKGEGFHTDYYSYALRFRDIRTPELDNIQRENTGRNFFFGKGGKGYFSLNGALTWLRNSFDVVFIQIFQGFIDSIGCVFVFGIIGFFFDKRFGLIGALAYAIYPAFIFYSYHFMSEAYIPFFMLAIGYTFILALNKEKWFWFGLAGFLIGLSFNFRSDNILILPFYIFFLFYYFRNRKLFGLSMAGLVLIFCFFSFMPFKMIGSEKATNTPTLGSALYNSLGEYPGTYRGLRFFKDKPALQYGLKKVDEYVQKDDVIFNTMRSLPFYNSLSLSSDEDKRHLIVFAYVREVIIGKPFLYHNRIVSRFFAYLPSHPFIACIACFAKMKNMKGYRYSEIFQFFKYIDYLFFITFAYGVWLSRKNTKLLSLLCIYFGVLISHVIVGGGEVYFRLDKEHVYLDPRYLLGMVSIWPVFIAVTVSHVRLSCFRTRVSKRNTYSNL